MTVKGRVAVVIEVAVAVAVVVKVTGANVVGWMKVVVVVAVEVEVEVMVDVRLGKQRVTHPILRGTVARRAEELVDEGNWARTEGVKGTQATIHRQKSTTLDHMMKKRTNTQGVD